MKRLLFVLILALSISLVLTACDDKALDDSTENSDEHGNENTDIGNGDTEAKPTKLEIITNGAADYQIVYPDGCEEFVLVAAETLAESFRKTARVEINVVSDAQITESSTKKIIVADANYSAASQVFSEMRYHDYKILVTNTDIIFAALSENGFNDAISHFEENVLSYTSNGKGGRKLVMEIERIAFDFAFDYAIPSFKINGTDISKYKIIYSEKCGEALAQSLADNVRDKCGYVLDVAPDTGIAQTEHEILLSDTNRPESASVSAPMPLHYVAQVNGGKLVIKSGGEHSFPKSLSPIMETLSAHDGGVVLNEGDSITGNLYDDDLDSSKPENSDLRIMSCNILAEFESWSGDPEVEMPYLPVDLRKEIFFAALNYYQPTVIGFQEMTPNWYAAAEEYDTDDVWEILKFANPNRNDGEYVFSTVMYRKDLYTLLDSGMRFYSKFKNGRSGCYTWAILKDNASGKEFCFLSTHWDGTGRPNGFLQAEELTAFVNEMKKSYPVFTTGDFNSNEISPELIQYLEDCDIVDAKQAAINRVNDVGSWHNFLQTNLSWGSCDHITATKDTTVLKFQTLYKNELIYCSDHCWLIADIKFN